MSHSAGILAYRRGRHGVEVFLVHPGGPFWQHRDTRAWSIPKGEFTNEAALDAARREFEEETGQRIDGAFQAMTPVRSHGKTIHAFCIESDAPDPDAVRSNTFELEWPPRSGRRQRFPEVDRAAWVPLAQARERIHGNQLALLEQLQARLGET